MTYKEYDKFIEDNLKIIDEERRRIQYLASELENKVSHVYYTYVGLIIKLKTTIRDLQDNLDEMQKNNIDLNNEVERYKNNKFESISLKDHFLKSPMNKWVCLEDIEKHYPECYIPVLVYGKGEYRVSYLVGGKWSHQKMEWKNQDKPFLMHITHWMPLPEKPCE